MQGELTKRRLGKERLTYLAKNDLFSPLSPRSFSAFSCSSR